MEEIQNLVFSGGGVRGVSFCGALMALQSVQPSDAGSSDFLPNLRRITGASVGALFAVAVAMGLRGERLFRLLDSEALMEGLVPLLDINRLQREYGFDGGQRLREAVLRVVEVGLEEWRQHPIPRRLAEEGATAVAATLTMAELAEWTQLEVGLAATRLGSTSAQREQPVAGSQCSGPHSSVIFSARSHPSLCVVDAIVMSMTVPLLFTPVAYEGGIYVDGGLVNNVPVDGMDPAATLLLRLKDTTFTEGTGLKDYLTSVLYAPVNWIEHYKIQNFPHVVTLGSGDVTCLAFNASRQSLLAGCIDGMYCTFRSMVATRRQREVNQIPQGDDDDAGRAQREEASAAARNPRKGNQSFMDKVETGLV